MPDEQKTVSRREVIKAGGLVALGLTYSKPVVRTVNAKPAFQSYGSGNTSGVSIEVFVDTKMSVPSCNPGVDVTFNITNVGSGDMASPLYYTIFRDDVDSGEGGSYQLASGQSMPITLPFNATNKIRLVAQQPTGHPGNSTPQASATHDCQDIDIS